MSSFPPTCSDLDLVHMVCIQYIRTGVHEVKVLSLVIELDPPLPFLVLELNSPVPSPHFSTSSVLHGTVRPKSETLGNNTLLPSSSLNTQPLIQDMTPAMHLIKVSFEGHLQERKPNAALDPSLRA
jgi:hypothetical protein